MLDCCKVAVTGTVSSGKSSVCRILQSLGAYVADADAIVHRLLSPDTDLGKKVITLLGSDIVTDGRLNRTKIAEIVFNDSALLRGLESILHPAVADEITAQYENVKTSSRVFIAEIPLLFESGSHEFYDWIVVVSAPAKACEERFSKKTSYGEQEYRKRNSRLMPLAEKEKKADFVLVNDGSLKDLETAVKAIYPKLLKKKIGA